MDQRNVLGGKPNEKKEKAKVSLHDGEPRVLPNNERFSHIKRKAENDFCVLLLLNSATMNIAFSFALVYSHVLDLSLCLSCLSARRFGKQSAACFLYQWVCLCVLYCNLDSRQTPKGASRQRRKKTLTLLEMKWREKENKRGIKNRMKI